MVARFCISRLISITYMIDVYQNKWRTDVESKPKLRTYKLFKSFYKTEMYAHKIQRRDRRSAIAKFRSGTFPIRIETGRYRNPPIPVEQRTCYMCDLNEVEDEKHVLMNCPKYEDIRNQYNILVNDFESFMADDNGENCKLLGKYLLDVLKMRSNCIT